MPSRIFSISSNGELSTLEEVSFLSEDEFQRLLATHPDLMAGEQIDPTAPRRWLLVTREAAVPDASTMSRWAVDHLFLDQDGIPTLVEVKRSNDTRLRREVVGQLLEYAAHAQSYWPLDFIRAQLTLRCEQAGSSLESELSAFLENRSTDEFWNAVKTNLDAGRIRLVFVADKLPPELKQVIEFLNGQMDPAQVVGVELPVFSDGTTRTIAPRVVGLTAKAQNRKVSVARQWDRPSFLDAIESAKGREHRDLAARILDWADNRFDYVYFGAGSTLGSFTPVLKTSDDTIWFFYLWTNGQVEIQFQWLRTRPPFDALETREELRQRLNEIPGVSIGADALERRPAFPAQVLLEGDAEARFSSVMEWAVGIARG
jgi:hypothetical protein